MWTKAQQAHALAIAGCLFVVVACADRSPSITSPSGTGPASAFARDVPSHSTQVRGRASVVVRRLGGPAPLGAVVQSAAGEYTATIDANGQAEGVVLFPGARVDLAILARATTQGGAAGGIRTLAGQRGAEGIAIRVTRAAGSPPEELELRRGAIVVGRIANAWERYDGGWRLTSVTHTAYQNGKPVMSITVQLEPPSSVTAAPATVAAGASGSVRRVPKDAVAFDETGVCEAEVIAMDNAMELYMIASTGMLGCLAGPGTCFAAILAVFAASSNLDAAVDKVELCLKKAE